MSSLIIKIFICLFTHIPLKRDSYDVYELFQYTVQSYTNVPKVIFAYKMVELWPLKTTSLNRDYQVINVLLFQICI